MPRIFSDDERVRVRERLMELGLVCLERRGYKASSIEGIAREAGIAKGTFYNFFTSKESFYFEIMCAVRDGRRRELLDFFGAAENLSREKTEDFLLEYVQRKNVHHYFSSDELNLIFRKIPEQRRSAGVSSTSFAAELMAMLPAVNPRCNCEVVVNYLNVIADFAVQSRSLSVGSSDETLRVMTRALTAYIFGEDR